MASRPPVLPHDGQDPAGFDSEPLPQILPPVGGAAPPQPVRRKPLWMAAPATYLLVGINCGVFLAMVAHGISLWMPTVDQLMHWGADRPNNVLIYGEWWRIVTAMFVHVGFLHLATNMWCLWNLGLLAEPLLGSMGLMAAYILTGAAGNLLSTFYNWVWPVHDPSGAPFFQAGAGASGAVFGIAGVLIVLLKSKLLPVPAQELKRLRKSVIYFAVINLVIGFSINFGSGFTGVSVDNSAHVGGFACGLLFALPLVPRVGSSRSVFQERMRLAVAMITGLLVLFGFYIAHVAPPQG
ncbi:MAG TPA: rhomboid family intramembrane serine protease [Terracidiphilus sp.]|jgi:rhomboid protease GluP|nr:rhomboid family intramembrane serine protease [Terracidiphilus sp.]